VLPRDTAGDQEALDPPLAALLCTLYAEALAGKQSCSLPKLCKRLGMRMSTLQRALTNLDGADVVVVEANAAGTAAIGLTETGRLVAEALSIQGYPGSIQEDEL
jgi:hypothetical protein